MKVERIGDGWVMLRIGPFYSASYHTSYWFRVFGRGLAQHGQT